MTPGLLPGYQQPMPIPDDLAERLRPFLGPWALADSPNPLIEVVLPSGAAGVRVYNRFLDEQGRPGQVHVDLQLDGAKHPHPAAPGGIVAKMDGDAMVVETHGDQGLLQVTERTVAGDTLSTTTYGWNDHKQWGPVATHQVTRSQVKQVLVYRRDLKMRKGKIAAQCAHASIAVFTRNDHGPVGQLVSPLDGPMAWWVRRSMAKIVLSVEGEPELRAIHAAAKARGLPTALIRDAGKTEFKGVPTLTTVAVGPAVVQEIDPITGKEGLVATKLA